MEADEELIKATVSCIEAINSVLENPWDFSSSGSSNVFNRYKDAQGLTNISKLLRNVAFIQRLYKLKDELVNSILSLQVLRGNITLTADKPDLSSEFLKDVQTEHLPVLTMRAIACLFDALAYFYDLPGKDDLNNSEETANYIFLRDPKLAVKIVALQKSEAFLINEKVVAEQGNGYFGLTKITPNNAGTFTMEAAKSPVRDELVAANGKVLIGLYQIISDFKDELSKLYGATLGYSSLDDLIVETEPDTGFWKVPKDTQKDEPNLFKLYDLWTKSAVTLETSTYTIQRNYLYNDSLSRVHRSTDQKTTSVTLTSDAPMKVEEELTGAQEGEYVWTHVLEFKKPIKRSGYRSRRLEDSCLLLTWITGAGVYSDESSRGYSHKASGVVSFPESGYGLILKTATNTLNKAHKQDADFYRLILESYRQAMQPATVEGRLVRIWEILDLIADYYREGDMKDIPVGYEDHDAVIKAIRDAFGALEKDLKIPITGEDAYTPILVQKSIGKKVRDVLVKYEVATSISVDWKDLKQRVGKVYKVRSKLTHSSSSRKGMSVVNEAMNTYYFISELVFVLMTRILTDSPGHIPDPIKTSLSGFVKDNNFYVARSNKSKNQSKQFNEMIKIFSGEKPWPKGKKTISI